MRGRARYRGDPRRRRACACLAVYCLLSTDYCLLSRAAAAPAPSYDVEVSLDLDAGTYAGREVVRYTNRTKGALDALYFNLYPNVGAAGAADRLLTVTSARVAGATVEVIQRGSGLLVRLADGLDAGEAVEVALEFEGRAMRVARDRTGLGAHVTDQVAVVLSPGARRPRTGAEEAVVSDDAMLLGNAFPVLSVTRDDGWQRRISAGDYAFAEASSYRIAVTAGEGVDVVAPGLVAAADHAGARVFEGTGLRSVAVFASRGFVRREDDAAGTRVSVVASPAHEAAARRALATLTRAVALYADLFGPPPFRQITVVEAPLMPGTPSAAFSGVVAVASAYFIDMNGPEAKDLPGFIRDTTNLTDDELEYAVLHETARQWWGESVGNDPQTNAFLDEGLSAYSAVIAIERLRGPEGAAAAVEQRMRAPYRVYRMFGGEDASADRRAGEFPNYFAYAAIVDAKSGMFLAALRKQFGDERFFDGLKRYYAAKAGRVARPEDFENAIAPPADHAGRAAYERLRDRWIGERHGDEDIGAPEYAVSVDPKVADATKTSDPDQPSGLERFGRFVGRKLAWFGKTAAKPF